MIKKQRQLPLSIQKLQALQRRIPEYHPKQPAIKESLAKRLAGYKGEQSIEYPLSFLSGKDFVVLNDVRLYDSKHYFQMDSLLLSKKCLIILEVKNMKGILYFDTTFHQLIRTLDGKQEAFPDPLLQVSRQEQQLKKWLEIHQLPQLPLLSLVVISNPNTIIQSTPGNKEIAEKVIRSEFLPTKINMLQQKLQEEVVTDKELKKLTRKIEKYLSPLDKAILEQFDLTKDDLIKGVFCPACGHLPLRREYGTWYCPHCFSKQKDAHISSIKDYQLLIGPAFTNSMMRDFLQISSTSLMTRLLQAMNLPYSGERKDRVYRLPTEY